MKKIANLVDNLYNKIDRKYGDDPLRKGIIIGLLDPFSVLGLYDRHLRDSLRNRTHR